ncbi:MAG TPA: zinc-finger domain-containing protein [Stellaceae bacterium]|nr:zinc-finger domain-containing protein [Stellaceae bacterium]
MPRSASSFRLAMGPSETIYIEGMVAACNGGGGPLGHPRVYLNLAPGGRAECPYCSRLFVNSAGAAGEIPPPQSEQERRSV